jgi:hypothetical protein
MENFDIAGTGFRLLSEYIDLPNKGPNNLTTYEYYRVVKCVSQ